MSKIYGQLLLLWWTNIAKAGEKYEVCRQEVDEFFNYHLFWMNKYFVLEIGVESPENYQGQISILFVRCHQFIFRLLLLLRCYCSRPFHHSNIIKSCFKIPTNFNFRFQHTWNRTGSDFQFYKMKIHFSWAVSLLSFF